METSNLKLDVINDSLEVESHRRFSSTSSNNKSSTTSSDNDSTDSPNNKLHDNSININI